MKKSPVWPRKPSKPVIIDYPVDRRRLKEEFDKMVAGPKFPASVNMALDMLNPKRKRRKKMKDFEIDCRKVGIVSGEVFRAICETLDKINESTKTSFILGGKHIMSYIMVHNNPEKYAPPDILAQVHDITFVGTIYIGPHGLHKVSCYEGDRVAPDELMVFGKEGNTRINLVGFPW